MYTKGQCMLMCPPDEISMREREGLLHPFEVLPGTEKHKYPKADPMRVVKSYCRSAAGINLACPDQLRTSDILFKTVKYLLSHIVNDHRFNLVYKYDFIADRLRSVRQDMVIQNLPPDESIRILEPCVSFHTLYGYWLCEENISQYDPSMNKKQLMEYLKQLLVEYDKAYSNMTKDEYLCVTEKMKKIIIEEDNIHSFKPILDTEIPETRQLLMESIYILINLGDTSPLDRYLNLPIKYKTGLLKLAYEISVFYMHKNWVKVCKYIHKLPPLAICAFALNLPNIRRLTFEIMSYGFNCKSLTYPISNIKNMLLFNCDSDVLEECNHYGIKISSDTNICFVKNPCIATVNLFPLKKLQIVENVLREQKPEVHLLGTEYN